MNNFFVAVQNVFTKIKELTSSIIVVALPVVGVLILWDIVFDTKIGVLTRSLSALRKVGISGNMLTVILVIGVVIFLYEKKK